MSIEEATLILRKSADEFYDSEFGINWDVLMNNLETVRGGVIC